MKHVLIIELSFSGHHPVYLEQIAAGYLNANHIVTIAVLKEFRRHPVITRLEEKFQGKIRIKSIGNARYHHYMEALLGDLGAELAKWYLFKQEYLEASSAQEVDYIFLPYLDYILYAVGLLGSPFHGTPWGGICMLASVHYDSHTMDLKNIKMRALKKYSFFRLLKNKYLGKFFVIDELLYKFAIKHQPESIRCLRYLMDPAEFNGSCTRDIARQELRIPENAIVILIYGTINSRKGVSMLMDALVLHELPKNIHLLIVGEINKSAQEVFLSKSVAQLVNENRIYIFNSFVDENLQQKVFAATDVVWLGYKDHYGMSGVLVMAAQARKVILSCNVGLIGWYTNLYNLGLSIDTEKMSEVKIALLELSDPVKIATYQNKIGDYFDDFTWPNAVEHILN